jgi:hypothetical protein
MIGARGERRGNGMGVIQSLMVLIAMLRSASLQH